MTKADLMERLDRAYAAMVEGTRAFCPPLDAKDVRRWVDEHAQAINEAVEWRARR